MTDPAPRRTRTSMAAVFVGADAPEEQPPKSTPKTPTLKPLKTLKPIETSTARSPKAPAQEPEPASGERPPSASAKPKPQRAPSAIAADERPALSVRMPVEVADRLAAYKAAHDGGITYLEILFRALAETAPRLPELMAADTLGEPDEKPAPDTIGGMFELPGAHRPKSARRDWTHKIWRTTEGNVAAVEKLAQQVGAESRQRMLLVALVAYLDTQEASER